MRILSGARSSPLSRAQFCEVQRELHAHHPDVYLDPVWAESPGDRDHTSSLKTLGKSDFFTRDLDQMLLQGTIRIAIHSAKDLPDPIPDGLSIVALTKGLDARDSLVFRQEDTLASLPVGAKIGASSDRREAIVKSLRKDLQCVELRGTIGDRIRAVEMGHVDGAIIAEAALIRLGMTQINRMILDGQTAPLQGRLAVLARSNDDEMSRLFRAIDLFRN